MSKRATDSAVYLPRHSADFGQIEDHETARESWRRFYEQGSYTEKKKIRKPQAKKIDQ